MGEQRLEDPNRSGATGPAGWRSTGGRASARRSRAVSGAAPLCLSRSSWSALRTSSRSSGGSSGTARPFCRRIHDTSGPSVAYSVSNTPSTTAPASASVRWTHHAVSPWTPMRATPTWVPICHGRAILCASTSNSAGRRKSRSRRVANRMSERIRATRKVRVASRSRSCPTTYQTPSSSRSAYGFSRRSVSRSRAGDQ